ncbi:MAG: hypothetical protein ACR2HS_04375, partial [Gammaproteobacteria bacterium]
MFKNYTRGGQVTIHSIRMFGQVSKRILLIAAIIYLATIGYHLYKNTNNYQWYLLGSYSCAQVKLRLQSNQSIHTVKELNGKTVKIATKQFVNNTFLHQQLTNFYQTIYRSLFSSLKITAGSLLIIIILLSQRGRLQKIDQ